MRYVRWHDAPASNCCCALCEAPELARHSLIFMMDPICARQIANYPTTMPGAFGTKGTLDKLCYHRLYERPIPVWS